MPVTRSSSHPQSQQPAHSNPYPNTRRAAPSYAGDSTKKSTQPSNDVIVLSSDDDKLSPKGTSTKKSVHRSVRKKACRSGSSSTFPEEDVLEISSDEETRPVKKSARKRMLSAEMTQRDLQRTTKKLREELKQAEKRLASTSREMEELKHDFPNKDILSGLEEYTVCEVCATTMWRPYILPECGHSFCADCLITWFSKTQVLHLSTNPQLGHNRAALAGQIQHFIQMVPNLHAYGQHGQHHARAVLTELRRHRPEYTCPSCRKVVVNKPVENFRLKGLIKEIAERLGEKSDRKDSSCLQGSGPFDHFFAAPIVTS